MEQIGTDTTKGNGKGKGENGEKDTGGRKNADKQEAIPDAAALAAALPAVRKALEEAEEAADKANKKIKATAKSTGFLSSIVKKAAKASMGEEETFEEKKREAEQMSLIFEELDKA